jgi:hypothetical protein
MLTIYSILDVQGCHRTRFVDLEVFFVMTPLCCSTFHIEFPARRNEVIMVRSSFVAVLRCLHAVVWIVYFPRLFEVVRVSTTTSHRDGDFENNLYLHKTIYC